MMSNVLEGMGQLDLTGSEQRIADLILADPAGFVALSSKQIASECHVSVPTIYRLCKKLGIDGLAGLRVAIAAAVPDWRRMEGEFDFDYPVKENQSLQQATDAMRSDYDQTLLRVFGQIDYRQLAGIVGLIKKKSVIDIYASSANVYFAQNFAFQMQEVGYQVNVPTDEYIQRLTATNADDTHVAFLISFSGRGALAHFIPRIVRARHTPLVLLASKAYADSFDGAEYKLCLNSAENHYDKVSSFSTRLSILFLLDLIYAGYFETDYRRFQKEKTDRYGLICDHRF